MQSEERHDDLTTLFEAQDEALQSEAFVERVMQPIRKRSRWRTPLLFGAGGVGVGAALSQIGGLWDALKARTPPINLPLEEVQTAQLSLSAWDPVWIGALAMMVLSCIAIAMSERA